MAGDRKIEKTFMMGGMMKILGLVMMVVAFTTAGVVGEGLFEYSKEVKLKDIKKFKTKKSVNNKIYIKYSSDHLDFTGSGIAFFDTNDNFQGKWEKKKEVFQSIYLSYTGEYCVLVMYGAEEIVVIDKNGSELSRFKIDYDAGSIYWAPNDEFFMISSMDIMGAYSKSGEELWKDKNMYDFKISPNSKYLAVITMDMHLKLEDMHRNSIYEIENITSKNEYILLHSVNNDGNVLLTPSFKSKKVLVYNKKGKKIKEMDLEFKPRHVVIISEDEYVIKNRKKNKKVKLKINTKIKDEKK